MAVLPSPSNTAQPQAQGFEANLDDLFLRFAVGPGRQMQINTAPLQAQAIQTSETPEDFQQEFGQIYSRTNFSGGEGLDKAHRREGTPNDFSRFWDSKGIDVFHAEQDNSYSVRLLKDVEQKTLTLSSENNYLAQTTNGYMYITDGTSIYQSIDEGVTWTAMTSTQVSYDIQGIVAFGNDLFIVTGDGGTNKQLISYDLATTTFTDENLGAVFTGAFTGIWFAKGALFLSGKSTTAEYLWQSSPFIHNFSGDFETADALVTTEPTHQFTDVIDAGAVVLAGNTDSNIYSLKIDGGTWSLKGQTQLAFEEIHSLAATEGIVYIGTRGYNSNTGRFYTAELTVADNLYVLANRQLIKEWDEGVDQSPHSMFVTRDSVYMGIHESATETNLWRYYLPTAGIARDLSVTHTSDTNAKVTGITQAGTTEGKFIILISGVGVYKQTDTFVSTGYIISALADFYTSENKQWVGAKLNTNGVSFGTVELATTTIPADINNNVSPTWENQITVASGSGGDEEVLELVQGRWMSVRLTITTSDTSQSPELLSFAVRGFQLVNDLVVDMPINISDQVERPFRKALRVNGQGELIYQALRNKEGQNVQLEIFRPDTLLRGIIENVSSPIEEISTRGSVTQYCLVRFRGSKVIATSSSGEGLAIGLLGVKRLG
ncbi:hypothetical protein OAR44_02695 [Acidimicrobiia bacterium]|nr:hypothetical protein [Acidimicrobiia bacterium]